MWTRSERSRAAATAAPSRSSAPERGTAHAGPAGRLRAIARSTQMSVLPVTFGVSRMTMMRSTDAGSLRQAPHVAADLGLEAAGLDTVAAGERGDEDRAHLGMALEPVEDLPAPALAARARRLRHVARCRRQRATGVRDREPAPARAGARRPRAPRASARRGCRRAARWSPARRGFDTERAHLQRVDPLDDRARRVLAVARLQRRRDHREPELRVPARPLRIARRGAEAARLGGDEGARGAARRRAPGGRRATTPRP